MAMISCPHCGEKISDQAEQCVHCGYRLQYSRENCCPECGAEVPKGVRTCPVCGCPMQKKKKKHRGVKLAVVLLVAALLAAAVSYYWSEKQRYEQAAAYWETVDQVFEIYNGSIDTLNECSKLLLDVWKNAIWKTKDPATAPYTRPNGKFVDDFNTALNALFHDPDYSANMEKLSQDQMELRKLRNYLFTPPEGTEEYNGLLMQFVDQYVGECMLLLNPGGSYNEISEEMYDSITKGNELLMELEAYS